MPEPTGISLGLGEYQTRVDCTESPVPHHTINFVVTADIIITQEHLIYGEQVNSGIFIADPPVLMILVHFQ